MNLGGGWQLIHLTDRVIELRKDCPIYRRFVGRDGYVKMRGEPGLDRYWLLNRAVDKAKACDAELSQRVAKQLMPSKVEKYRIEQRKLATAFGVPGQEPEEKVYKP
jgi:hypothetical protein